MTAEATVPLVNVTLQYGEDGILRPQPPDEIDLNGILDKHLDIEFWGKAKRQPDGKYHCIAKICGVIAKVEVTIKPKEGIAP